MNNKFIIALVLVLIGLLTIGGCEVSGGVSKQITAGISPGTIQVSDLPLAGVVCSSGIAKSVTPDCFSLSSDGRAVTNNCGGTQTATVTC